jgi:uncharacterized protein YceK
MKPLLLIIPILALTGCGTVINHIGAGDREPQFNPKYDPDGRPYGGVRWDLKPWSAHDETGGTIFIVDVPFSLVGDTVMLPYDIYREGKK